MWRYTAEGEPDIEIFDKKSATGSWLNNVKLGSTYVSNFVQSNIIHIHISNLNLHSMKPIELYFKMFQVFDYILFFNCRWKKAFNGDEIQIGATTLKILVK